MTHGKLSLDYDTDRCWCCRALENWWLDKDGNIDQSRNTTIERCHIVADSLGGSNNPLNFILLCSYCHRKSPDIKSDTAIFRWMEAEYDKRKAYTDELIEQFKAHFPEMAMGDFKQKSEAIIHVFEVRDSKKFKNFFYKNTSWHFGESDKASTLVLALREFIDKHRPFPNYPLPKEVVS
jgi:hypothetical protein